MVRWFRRLALLLLGLILVFAIFAWWMVRASLPQLDGQVVLGDLSAPVTIQRDALGVVTIDAANETDAMRALGYVHAQERYFEMDLMRRTAAGELSELFGPIALLMLFAASFALHAATGLRLFNEERLEHGQEVVGLWGYVGSSEFWFESFQNWQSEFLAVLGIVLLTIFLRQRGSPQSKPVAASHASTND